MVLVGSIRILYETDLRTGDKLIRRIPMHEPDRVSRVDVNTDRGAHQPVVREVFRPQRVDFKHRDHRSVAHRRAVLDGIFDRTLSDAAGDDQRKQR